VTGFLASQVFARRGRFWMVPVTANGQPAFAACQREDDGSYRVREVLVLTVTTTGIARIVVFLDPGPFAALGPAQEDGRARGDSGRPRWSISVGGPNGGRSHHR